MSGDAKLEVAERAAALAEIRELSERQRVFYYEDPEYVAMDKRIAKQLRRYVKALPRVVMGVCPFCREPLVRTFDPGGLDGPWWFQQRPMKIAEPKPCRHFKVLLGAFRLKPRRRPTEAGDSLISPGPDLPFVIPELLELPNMHATIGELEMDTGDRAFPIAYFSDKRIAKRDLHSEWCRSTEYTFKGGWRICNEAWDFGLRPYFEAGQCSWWSSGNNQLELSSDFDSRPLAGMRGQRRPQFIADGAREWGDPPTGEIAFPFEFPDEDAEVPDLTEDELEELAALSDAAADGDLSALLEGDFAGDPQPDPKLIRTITLETNPTVVCGLLGGEFATGGDRGLQIRDLATGKVRADLGVTGVQSLALDATGCFLAAGGYAALSLIDVRGRKLLWTVKDFYYYVWAVSFRPGRAECIVGGDDKKLTRISNEGHILGTIEGHDASVKSVVYHPDGDRLASGSDDKTIRVWMADGGQPIRLLRGHTGSVEQVAFAQGGDILISVSDDGHAIAWDWAREEQIASLYRGNHVVRTMAVVPETNLAVIGFGDDSSTAAVWDWRRQEVVMRIPGAGANLSLVPNSRDLVGRSWSSELVVASIAEPT